MSKPLAYAEPRPRLSSVLGKAAIVRSIYEGRDPVPLWRKLLDRVSADQTDAAALLDLSTLLYSIGEKRSAAIAQAAAMRLSRSFRVDGDGKGDVDLLLLTTPGDLMATSPVEFLLEGAGVNVLLHYVDANTAGLADLPAHDVAFVAVAESAANLPVLRNLERLLRGWTGPIMNNMPGRISQMTRDGVAAALAGIPSICAPVSCRVSRNVLEALAGGVVSIDSIGGTDSFPFIVRPIDSHAGNGMVKIAERAELLAFLDAHVGSLFYVTPFVDYSDADGLFRKQRIAFIDGKAFASHMAVSEHWMVHYVSARMSQHPERCGEEAAWMADFDRDFAVRHAAAFEAMQRLLGLDYFAIDCAELSDGRLLVFEADVAMFVHSMDSAALYPYKRATMQKLFDAFEAALRDRARRFSGQCHLRLGLPAQCPSTSEAQ